MPVFRLSERISFPPPHFAEPEGLLAVGGDLSEARILLAYQMGIFPWFSDDDPILWWSPDPRLVLYPSDIRVSRRLKRTIRRKYFHVTCDTAFDQVINACAGVRLLKNQPTWIQGEMIDAYCRLFASGYAHSFEVWHEGRLAGGLYGISLGGSFFGESMFSRCSDASKVALAALCRYLQALSFDMVDCQVPTDHLMRMGAVKISRTRFLRELRASLNRPTLRGNWRKFVENAL
ncbi:MAG: leucyl/phenylalanyl-tRNA--protein transferase [Desulfosalsimonadaceae bacterium]|nr:leucyl/phenylalanyl-tRNA--protein transferase [Desulfosalsimonadaceae bacterium]